MIKKANIIHVHKVKTKQKIRVEIKSVVLILQRKGSP